MRNIFARMAHALKSDMQRAVDELTILEPAFLTRLDLAAAIIRHENELFNEGARYNHFSTSEKDARAYIRESAVIRLPEKIEGHWHTPTLAQSLKRTIDRIVAQGPRYRTLEEIDQVDGRIHRARIFRDDLDKRLRDEGFQPL